MFKLLAKAILVPCTNKNSVNVYCMNDKKL